MLFQRYKVSGQSMYPALKEGDYILTESFSYLFNEPKIGDLVIVKKGVNLVKRITQKIGRNYFIEGDNKNFSTDSRSFGFINKSNILGKVIVL